MPNVGARNGTTVRGSGDVFRQTATADLEASFDGTGTFSCSVGGVVDLFPNPRRFRGRGIFEIDIPPEGDRRRLVVTDVEGNLFGELEKATIGNLVGEINRPRQFTLALPIDDEKGSLLLDEEFREVQFWRGDQLLCWGPVVKPSATEEVVGAEVKGADWHLLRRTVGKAERENLLENGNFENGLKGWTVLRHTGETEDPSLAFILQQPVAGAKADSIKVAQPKEGFRVCRIVDVSTDLKKPFVFQEVVVSTGDFAETFTFTAYAYLPSGAFVEPNPRDTGLLLGALPSNYRSLNYPGLGAPLPPAGYSNMIWTSRNLKFFALDFAKFGSPPPLDQWIRLEAAIEVPPNQTVTIQARLEGPRGQVYYDVARLVRSERLHFSQADQTSEIAHDLVYHAQGLTPAGAPDPDLPDKSDVNVIPHTSPSRVYRDRDYLYSEHPGVFESLSEFFELRDGFDYGMLYTPTERRFVTYFPERGQNRPKYGLELGRNLSGFAWAFNGESAASSVIVLGEGSGDGREEAAAIDTSAFAGGLTLEEVLNAPDGTTYEALEAFADEELERAKSPETLAVRTRPNPRAFDSGADGVELIGRLQEGDFVPVRIEKGPFLLEDTYRVVRWSLTSDDRLELVLNRRSPR